jgi:5-amino-6-(5-phosphoribosylamino)uracil reductase
MMKSAGHPYVMLKCAMSIDGFIDDSSPNRLILSNDDDFDRVDAIRAEVDAIMIGANTLRKDNPTLLIRSLKRKESRRYLGRPENITKVIVTASGRIDSKSRLFEDRESENIIYTVDTEKARLAGELHGLATVVGFPGSTVNLHDLLTDLGGRGIRRLLVEGGTKVSTQLLAADLVDELHVAIAPFFVGEENAPRFVGPAAYPWNATKRMTLSEIRNVGDMAVLYYSLRPRS